MVYQQVDSRKWILLGSYGLAPGNNHRVMKDDIGGEGRLWAESANAGNHTEGLERARAAVR
ncbi:MAG: hypothetical protein JKY12_06500 [Sneathiella sp.]|nr:hypothetical protein [Sneathiella sp.]